MTWRLRGVGDSFAPMSDPNDAAMGDAAGAVAAAVEFLRPRLSEPPRAILILGSGLGALADEVEGAVRVPFADIPGFPAARVEGHRGVLVSGRLEDLPCLVLQGRFHLYEGHSAATAALPVRAAAALGAGLLLVTNAAGGLRSGLEPGDLMVIRDHINLMGQNPLVGAIHPGERRFPDLSGAYDARLRALAERVAAARGIPLATGVYCGVLGPSYETPAEIRMIAALGADAVGMSTVPEVIAARAAGLDVLGISLITNLAAGLADRELSHEEVVEAGREAAGRFTALIRGVLAGVVGAGADR